MIQIIEVTKIILIISSLLFGVSSLAEEKWYPSKYGIEDTIGAANNLSTDIVWEAAKLVTKGKVYSLGIDVGSQTPGYPPHRIYQVIVVPRGKPSGKIKTTGHDDVVIAWQGLGTQIDGLGHIGINYRHYNGIPADEIYGKDGVRKFSIHEVPPIVTRGVMLDMAGYYGVDMVKKGTAFNRNEIDNAAARQGVKIQKGDVVLFNTGWLNLLSSDANKFYGGEPGIGKEGAQYLAKLGVVAVGADTGGVEVAPGEVEGETGIVHQILLAHNGVYILENINTHELAADGVSEFLFVLGQPRLVGAVQAIVNPIAIH